MSDYITKDQIADIEVDGVDTSDYPDFCDAYITSAVWSETGVGLTDEELERIDPDAVYQAVVDYLY